MQRLSRAVADLSPEKRRALEKVLRARGVELDRSMILPTRRDDGPLPLSFAQQRLWFHHRLAPDDPSYNMAMAVRLAGRLDRAALVRALEGVQRRHESFRTVFSGNGNGDEPAQVISPPGPQPVAWIDLAGLGTERATAEARRIAAAEALRPFDLGRGPLLRSRCLRLGSREHVLLLTMHHIVCDGWSQEVLLAETAALYRGAAAGEPDELPEPPIQYADYAAWQRRWLSGEVYDRQLAYWRRRLDGLAPLELATDRPRGAAHDPRGVRLTRRIGPAVRERLREIGRRLDATPFMVLLAVCQVMLRRQTGRDDFAVGTPIANRDRPEVKGVVGFFVNTLVIRADLADDPTFEALVRRVREITLEAYEHQDLPFERLVSELSPDREAGRSPLFQVLFAVQNAQPAPPALPGVRLERFEMGRRTAKFDLNVIVVEEPEGGLRLDVELPEALFYRSTIVRLMERFARLARELARQPGVPVSEVAALAPAERQQLLVEWAEPPPAPPEPTAGGCLHERILAHAELRPQAPAVAFGDETLSHAELAARARRLARHLRELGVGPERRVALLLERSADAVVALLGILAAGGAYVPLDPGAPSERLADLLDELAGPDGGDAASTVVVTTAALARTLAGALPTGRLVAVRLDADREILDGRPSGPLDDPGAAADPSNAAYVLFTSGSTGRPKGVVVEHRQVVAYATDLVRRLGIGPGAAFAVVQPLVFDSVNTALFPVLIQGGCVRVVPETEAADPEAMAELYRRHAIDGVKITPSHLDALGSGDEVAGVLPRRWLVVGGEASRHERLRSIAGLAPELAVVNHYGPTETTVGVTTHRVAAGARPGSSAVSPLGRPLPSVAAYVADRDLEPAPAGVPGELLVGGAHVARGYLGRPAATAERFVPDPFGAAGGRLYRTGDLARHLPDGTLEFLGRIDQQVKLRGHRVEPGEIESALCRLDGVAEAVVAPRDDGPGGARRLVAWVVPAPGAGALDAPGLAEALRGSLPEYMVPAAFVALEALPRTVRGKIDRARLPAPAAPERTGGAGAAPRTEAEAAVVAIWKEVLGVDEVGAEDNFFELGGDSILGIQVVSRAARRALRLTPRQIFDHQTPRALAAAAVRIEGTEGDGQAAVQAAAEAVGAVPLTPIQARFLGLSAEATPADPHHYNQAALLAAPEPLDAGLLARALDLVAGHHDMLRARFTAPANGDGGWSQRVPAAAEPHRPVRIDLSTLPPDARGGALEAAAGAVQASLDLGRGPLLRAALVSGAGRERLLLVIHHLVVDAVSFRVLLGDLEAVYRALEAGETPALPPRTTPFRTWARRLQDHAGSARVAAEVHHWRAELAPVDHLPVAATDGADAAGGTVSVTLDAERTEGLLTGAARAYRSGVEPLLLAALVRTLAEWPGREPAGGRGRAVAIELEGHGREHPFDDLDPSRTVGWFTVRYPLRVETAGARDPGDLVRRVKEKLRAVPQGGLGYGLLRYLAPEGGANGSPAGEGVAALRGLAEPEVSFNYLGRLDAGFGGGRWRPTGESPGPMRSARQPRRHRLEVACAVSDGRCHVRWSHGGELPAAAVRDAAGRFLAHLEAVVDHCLRPGAGGPTPSDFPLARVEQEELDRWVASRGVPDDLYPATPIQQGLFFHSTGAPGDGAEGVYVEQMSLSLDGAVDTGAFAEAWRALARRHPVLRTGFVWSRRDELLQWVAPEVELPIEVLDLSTLPAQGGDERQDERLRELIADDRRRGFDPERPPLFRLTIARLGEDLHHFLWSHHHILLDGWSAPVLIRELFALYEGLREGRPVDLPPARPYRDYVTWLAEREWSGAEAAWRAELAGLEAPTPLAIDRGADALSEPARGQDRLVHRTPAPVVGDLRALARRRHLTLNTLVQGAWAFLLSRYAGEDDVVYGAVVSGRSAPIEGIEKMIGLFINTLPARVRVGGREPAAGWLERVQETQARMRQLEHTPLSWIQGWSGLAGGVPLFESILVFENYPWDEAAQERAGRSLRVASGESIAQTNYPLCISAAPGDDLAFEVLYDPGRFEAATIERLPRHLEGVLRAFVRTPEAPLGELAWMPEGEQRQVLVEWGAAPATPSGRRPPTLVDAIVAHARAEPGAVAVVAWEAGERQAVAYGELLAWAERLAARLAEAGVGLEDRVAICLPRSADLIAATLAVMGVGAAYVPLDPDAGAERLAFMLADADAAALVTDRELAGRFAEHPAPVLLVEEVEGGAPGAELRSPDPRSLAYVLYTSGSTGRPKAVMVSHGSLMNAYAAWERDYGLAGDVRRHLQMASFSFDVWSGDLARALGSGGRLILCPRELLLEPADLLAVMAAEGVHTGELVPALVRPLVRHLEERGARLPGCLRLLVVGSDSWTVGEARRLAALAGPECRVVNSYGVTEATIDTTWQDAAGIGAHLGPLRPVPIGRPFAGSDVRVLDRDLRPTPVDVPGELFLGGLGVARGYLGRPALTAERFVPDPFGAGGERLYRTGDRARWLAGGSLELLGRADHQVKLRGFRVELGEIEAVLGEAPGVGDRVVVLDREGAGEPRLVAYFAPAADAPEPADPAVLRRHLERRLPGYMVPAALVELERLPRLPSGKVDRRALPRPDTEAAGAAAPATPLEEIVAGFFADLLGAGSVGADADFFALGGHSLLAMRLVARVRRELAIELPIRAVFEDSRVDRLARRIDRAARSAAGLDAEPIRPVPRDRPIPLSFAQQRLWFLDRLEGPSAVYNVPLGVRVSGLLDAPVLARALGEIVRRHEALRTRFEEVGGRPAQVVDPAGALTLANVDLAGLPAGRRHAEAERIARAEARKPFDLTGDLLFRSRLLVLDDAESVLLLTMHHTASDGGSLDLLMEELVVLYRAFGSGEPSPLPELPIQYADYAVWQRRWLEGGALDTQLAYWRERLDGIPESLELPTDRPRPAVLRPRGRDLDVSYPPDLLDAVRRFSRQRRSTLFMTLMAAFQVLLARHAGQGDFGVGTPVSGRDREGTEGLIGFFVNMLVMRAELSDAPTFAAHLDRVRAGALAAYAHADVPYERLVDALEVRRDLSRNPLFQAVLQVQNDTGRSYELPGLEMSMLDVHRGTAMFELRLSLSETPEDGLLGFFEYNDLLYDLTAVERMGRHLETLLRGLVERPEARVDELPLLSPAERRQVIDEWNDTARTPARLLRTDELFAESAARRPDAVAVVDGARHLSYRGLAAAADRLAARLLALGVGPGRAVGVLLDRSAEMVTAVLGVHRAGGAYVPLDTKNPETRMESVLAQTGARVLLAEGRWRTVAERLAARLPELDHVVGGLAPAAPGAADDPAPAHGGGLDDPAYVIFTSGSTGTPKGVVERHRPVANLIDWVNRTAGVGPDDRILFVTSLGFDLSVYDVFGVLAAGGTVRVASDAEVADPAALARILARERPTFWDSAPAALQQVAPLLPSAVAEAGGPPALQRVFLSGDWVPLTLPDEIRAAAPDARITALGGATEATVWSNSFPVGEIEPHWRSVPYGRPIQNARYYVLDRHLSPCPIGVAGDLFIAGECLSDGYAAAPALTAVKFVPDPFARRPGAVMYRTGDRARSFGDGNLEFLGRLDHQVKIRGFRIELGEIEAVLAEDPAVREVVVLARRDGPADRRLVAYAVAREGRAVDGAALVARAREHLPEYMVPAAVVALSALPVTANGKLDRDALPAPERMTADAHAAPRNATEERLAAIWREVLQLERIGVHDDFFELGGDSILSIQVVSRASASGLEVSPRQIFEHSTVAGLAAVVRERAVGAEDAAAEAGEAGGEVPLTPIQRWLLEQELPALHQFNQAILLRVERALDLAALHAAAEGVLARHEALRLRFEPVPGDPVGWRQGVAPADGAPVCRLDLDALPAARRAPALEAAAAALQGSLRLAEGPLVRFAVLRPGGDGDRLLVVAHHLVIDGVSWRMLLDDLVTGYTRAAEGADADPPPATASFRRWAAFAAERAREEEAAGLAEHWLRQGESAPPPLAADRPEGGDLVAGARELTVELDAGTTAALQSGAQRIYRAGLEDVLLTALARAMAGRTGERRLLVDLERHGRDGAPDGLDLSRTVGWFTSMAPVLVDLEGCSDDPGDALAAVKEQVRALPARGHAYGRLRYLGSPELRRRLAALPAPEIVLNFHGRADLALGGAGAAPADPAAGPRLEPAPESAGPTAHPSQPRSHAFEVTGAVRGGALRVTWTFGGERWDEPTVAAIAERFVAALRETTAHVRSAPAPRPTPSDYPAAGLDAPTLDRLVERLGGAPDDVYPVTAVQRGMLFHSVDAPGSGVYVEQLAFRMEEPLDETAFGAAWRLLMERHPVLRTSFVWEDVERPLQVVHREVAIPWLRSDWRDLPAERRDGEIARLLERDRRRGFDLAAAPAMRLVTARLGERTWQVVWTFHHLVLDGWSLPVLLGELFALYHGHRRSRVPALPPVRPYRAYVEWLEARDWSAAEAYWRRTLEGFAGATPLVVDRQRTGAEADGSGAGFASLRAEVPAAATRALQRLARGHRLTLNTLFQGAWALLLHRYSGEDDLVFGVVCSGRSAPVETIDRMVGLFINTLPARVRLRPGDDLASVLRSLQESQAELRQFEHTPLARVRSWSGAPPGQPLFESILAFENYPVDEALKEEAATAGETSRVELLEQSNYPLNLLAAPGERFRLETVYDRDRFDRPAAVRLLRHLTGLLEDLAGDPRGLARRVDSLGVLSPAERHQILVEWNDTEKPCPQEPMVHELFAEHARRRPQAEAITTPGGRLTYGDVEARSNRLAHHLRRLGVGPEVLVALCTDRTPDRVVAVVAVIKAGGAYVSLDPTHPPDRLRFLLEDAAAPVILTEERFAGVLPESDATVIRLDRDWDSVEGDESAPPEAVLTPDHLAYVVYTSGSTGKPKGVAISHAGLMNLVRWHDDCYSVRPEDRGTQIASPAFDASIWELWPYLAAGASVHAPDDDIRLSSIGMLRWWSEQRITLAYLMTPLAEGVLEEPYDPDLPLEVRALIIGGDRLHRRPDPRLGLDLMNHYGPAEYSVTCTVGRVPIEDDGGVPSVGRVLDNSDIYILDAGLAPVPAGVPGELFVAGIGLARGYLRRPSLTAEKFIPDPFAAEPGARMYRTGDLTRYLPDGEIDFLERLDHQVKVRGMRIELGEIESVVGSHPGLRDVAVLVREDRPREKRIVAYAVPATGTEPDVEDLKRYSGERLPPYMVPVAWVVLDRLPLSPNGKVDRRALPAPVAEPVAGTYEPPRTEKERLLAQVWADVLRVERLGIHDDFFELGGDSILSIQIGSRAARAGLRVTSRQVFENPTVAGLAAVAEAIGEGARADAGPVTGEAPATPIQRRFLERGDAAPAHFNQALLLAPAPGSGETIDTGVLGRALARLLEHHDALRARFDRDGGTGAWRQRFPEPGEPPALGVVDLSRLADAAAEAERGAVADRAQASLDLAAGPLLRAVVTRGAGPARLLLVIHHLVVDGVSWRVLVEDLDTVYGALAAGRRVDLPPRTTSFKRWAEELAGYAGSSRVAEQALLWAEADEPTALPVDHRRGENDVASAATVRLSLPEDATRALLAGASHGVRARPDEMLMTGLALALARWTGGWRFRVDLEGHGREESLFPDVDLSRTVGWFTSLYPVDLELPGAPEQGPLAALAQVKEALRAVPDGGLAYGLSRHGAEDGAPGAAPGPGGEVLFNYLGQLDAGGGRPSATGGETDAEDGGGVDAGLRVVPGSTGRGQDPRALRDHLVEVNAATSGGRLQLGITYSRNRHEESTVEALAGHLERALRELAAAARRDDRPGTEVARAYVPSDFPLAGLDREALHRVVEAAGGAVEDVYPLAPVQEGMLFHTAEARGSGLYVEQMSLVLDDSLDQEAFERAWRRMVDRHPIFRSAFLWLDVREPLQVVLPRVELDWNRLDWTGPHPDGEPEDPSEDLEERLRAFLAEDRRRGFDVSRAPLMRWTLIRTAEDRWRFVWSFHHVLLDGWSMGPFLEELFAFYRAESEGADPALPRVRPYRDFIAWLHDRDAEADRAYWAGVVGDVSAPTPLPLARPLPDAPPAERTYGSRERRLGPEESQAIEGFARSARVTVATLVQAAWALLLARHAGQDDVLFGAVLSGRSAPIAGIDRMMGLFINTLPTRIPVPAEAELESWLRDVQTRQTELRQFEHGSLSRIQRWSALPRGVPLFETVVAFENYPVDDSVREQTGDTGAVGQAELLERTNFPLHLIAGNRNGLFLKVLHDGERYDAARVDRLLDQLTAVLVRMTGHAGRPLAELSLVSDAEREVLPDASRVLPRPDFPSLARHLERVAREGPDRVAVVQGGRHVSYGRLVEQARSLAATFDLYEVPAGAVVGITGERSPEMVAAIVAVVLSGRVLLTLDRRLPAPRRREMAERAEARCLVRVGEQRADDREAEAVESLEVLPVPVVAEGDGAFLPPLEETPTAGPDPDAPAYVFFTSGTTGRPKGIVGRQRGLAHFLAWQRERFAVSPDDRGAQLTALSFDVVLRDLFLPLGSGAALVLPEGDDLGARAVLPWLARERVTLLHTVPSLAAHWVEEAGPASDHALRRVFFAGEPLSRALVEGWRDRFPGGEVVNLYGPTETTLAKCFYPVPEPPEPVDPGIQPVGFPLPQSQALILDGDRLCATGEIGEIVIRTPFRSLGFLDPEPADRDRFRANPLRPDDPDDPVYRTGDRGRVRIDGAIEILGRLDDQVKVRGMRVEPAEVAAVLETHPRLSAAAVIATGGGAAGDTALVAYVVGGEGDAPAARELRAWLAGRLPDFMVPRAFVALPELPLTANGKLDRRALPAPGDTDRPTEPGRRVAPRTRLEVEVALLCEELLGVSGIGVHDDFFDVGGHSLLAMRLVAGLEDRFACRLALADLYRARTIEGIAAVLEEDRGDGEGMSPIVRLRRGGSQPPLYLLPPAGGGVSSYLDLAARMGDDRPLLAFQARGLDAGEEPHESIEAMASDYLARLREERPDGPYVLCGWSFGGRVAFEMARRLEAEGPGCELLVLIDTPAPEGGEDDSRDDASALARIAGARGLTIGEDELRDLEPAAALDWLLDQLGASGAIAERDREALRRMIDLHRASLLATWRYRGGPYAGPVSLIRADEALDERYARVARDRTYGWSRLCRGPIQVVEVPGDHLTILEPPAVDVLADALRRILSRPGAATRAMTAEGER